MQNVATVVRRSGGFEAAAETGTQVGAREKALQALIPGDFPRMGLTVAVAAGYTVHFEQASCLIDLRHFASLRRQRNFLSLPGRIPEGQGSRADGLLDEYELLASNREARLRCNVLLNRVATEIPRFATNPPVPKIQKKVGS
jgi:hypothetical protein